MKAIQYLLPLLICFSAMYLFAASPLLRAADGPPTTEKNRVRTLDGLRGFLASAVFLHHAALYRTLLAHGEWAIHEVHFLEVLGDFAVALFFMITGYLFWGKLLKDNGRPDWRKLYIGRIFRIGPLYLVAALWLLFCSFVVTRFSLRVPASQALREASSWLLPLGILQGSTSVNGFKDAWRFLAGVTWTIHFEWLFYASLIVIAAFPRWSKKSGLYLPACALLVCLVRVLLKPQHFLFPPSSVIIIYFSCGMLAAALLRSQSLTFLRQQTVSVLTLILCFAYFRFPLPYTAGPVLCLCFIFFAIAAGNSLFGILETRPAIRLGDISYGIYLLQGVPLLAFMAFRGKGGLSSLTFTLVVTMIGLALVSLATLAHIWIERPGIKLGARFAKAIPSRAVPSFMHEGDPPEARRAA